MNVHELQKYFDLHPSALSMGAGLIGKRTHSHPELVREAKRLYRQNIRVSNSVKIKPGFPKILIFDIETAPIKAWVWNTWKENISLDKTISDYFIICWSAKWLYSDEVFGACCSPEEILEENDSRIVKLLWKAFDDADIIIAHNGNSFDIPRMNTRFILNGLEPPTPYQTIDTLKVAKKQFGFTSNKLQALATYFGLDGKLDTDFNLWKACMNGDQQALDYMFDYNKQDVKVLEEVYLKLLPFITNHPNMGNLMNRTVCSNCGSDELELIPDKFYYTSVGKYALYRCKDCGAITRGRTNLNKEKVALTSRLR